ncbi:MAG TPA: hypothetical protein DCF63_00230 [Planctomycetaceae bacterium]|nr:hypothetical protein [Planctomycetaceae bacterium]
MLLEKLVHLAAWMQVQFRLQANWICRQLVHAQITIREGLCSSVEESWLQCAQQGFSHGYSRINTDVMH